MKNLPGLGPGALMTGACAGVMAQDVQDIAHGVRNDLPRPYETRRDWGQLPEGTRGWGAVTAVEPPPDGRFIYVIHRCYQNSCEGRPEPPILKFDYEGRLLAAFGTGLFLFPHGATVDAGGNLWVTDARANSTQGHQVFKFSPGGEVLMTLGQAGIGRV